MNITEARAKANTAHRTLLDAIANGTATEQTDALTALNTANREAVAAGATELRGHVTIVDGKPFSGSTVTPERATEVMANAAARNK